MCRDIIIGAISVAVGFGTALGLGLDQDVTSTPALAGIATAIALVSYIGLQFIAHLVKNEKKITFTQRMHKDLIMPKQSQESDLDSQSELFSQTINP